jgi:hypothetical protein
MPRRRDLYLIRKGNSWAVCFKATGRLNGHAGKILAWLRDHDESYLCTVGTEDQIENLPGMETKNFFGDQFTFTVDETDEKGNQLTRLSGANNVSAARAAFHVYLKTMPPARHIRLRDGGRVILKGHDQKIEE